MKDDLGTRMKENYEYRTRTELPRRTHTIIRLDGKAFHSLTKGCDRPYDLDLMEFMNETAKFLCEQIQGCTFAYVQSDEISLLIQDFKKIKTDAWFDGNIQKIASISASMATAQFNKQTTALGMRKILNRKNGDTREHKLTNMAFFDSRVFTIPELEEVVNYFIWRQQDATKNSISMAAQVVYSHNELHKKNGNQKQDMLHEKGINWNDYPIGFKRGRVVKRVEWRDEMQQFPMIRTKWSIVDPPIFTQDRNFIKDTVTFEAESVKLEVK